MKKSILLALLPLILASCTTTKPQEENNSTFTPTPQQTETGEGGNSGSTEQQQGGNNQETQTGGQEQSETGTNTNVEHPTNTQISLDEWKNYAFHDGHEPCWNDEWDFYYGTTHNPISGCFFENPNEKVDYSGIDFSDKKQYLMSPNFESYLKVEVKFTFWFSSHTSSRYKAEKNQPQFKIEEYNSSNKLINTDVLEIEKSDIPNNNTAKEIKIYIRQSSMTHFDLRFNNFIANGDSGYTAELCDVALKGWDYE